MPRKNLNYDTWTAINRLTSRALCLKDEKELSGLSDEAVTEINTRLRDALIDLINIEASLIEARNNFTVKTN